jgi:hypothetical protein
MSLDQPPWSDAERIPEERILDVFKPPPAIPATFIRSALVVGSRGAGKTILFRYLKETHKGFATHIYLSTEFASLTKAGYGPLAPKYPEDIEKKLSGKATALLAIAIADRLQRKGLSIPSDPLIRCLPGKFRQKLLNIDAQWVNDTRELVNKETLATFDEVAVGSPLVNFINTIEESNHRNHGPLLLLLDRADVVPPPALIPVFELLDQGGLFTTLVATRPGIGGESLSRTVRIVAPGDSYDVVHLGLYPRSSDWTDLVGQALEAQFGVHFLSLPQAVRDSIKVFARDSIKIAVELTSWCTSLSGGCTSDDLVRLLEELRDSRLTAAQRTLQTYVDDFRDSIRTIHEQTLEQHGSLTPGVLVTIKQRTQPVLFHEHTALDIFVDAALRSWAVCMPEGQRWVPGLRPTQVEIPPLLIWTKNDRVWTTCDPLTQITISPSELTSRRGPRPRRPTIFIAYRMNFQESKRFRNNLEAYIHSYPGLNEAVVTDGNVPTGARWPETIRKRISKSHIAVGDVEGMRPDILFELGFAYGQGKVFIPAFKSHLARIEEIPDWLRGRQIGHYGEDSGLEKISGKGTLTRRKNGTRSPLSLTCATM